MNVFSTRAAATRGAISQPSRSGASEPVAAWEESSLRRVTGSPAGEKTDDELFHPGHMNWEPDLE